MHETHLIQPIIESIAAHAEREGAQRVLKVRLRIGELTGIKEESFKATFEILAQGSISKLQVAAVQDGRRIANRI